MRVVTIKIFSNGIFVVNVDGLVLGTVDTGNTCVEVIILPGWMDI